MRENPNLLATSSPKHYNTRQLRRPVNFLSCSLLRYEEFLIVVAVFFLLLLSLFLPSFICSYFNLGLFFYHQPEAFLSVCLHLHQDHPLLFVFFLVSRSRRRRALHLLLLCLYLVPVFL